MSVSILDQHVLVAQRSTKDHDKSRGCPKPSLQYLFHWMSNPMICGMLTIFFPNGIYSMTAYRSQHDSSSSNADSAKWNWLQIPMKKPLLTTNTIYKERVRKNPANHRLVHICQASRSVLNSATVEVRGHSTTVWIQASKISVVLFIRVTQISTTHRVYLILWHQKWSSGSADSLSGLARC